MRKNQTLEVATSRPFNGMDKPALRTQQTAKHTPGPWVCEYGCVYTKKRRNAPRAVLGTRIALMDREESDTSPTERDANARLIATAPELLATLQAILDLQPDDDGVRLVNPGFLDGARAAITKATGHDS